MPATMTSVNVRASRVEAARVVIAWSSSCGHDTRGCRCAALRVTRGRVAATGAVVLGGLPLWHVQ